MGSNNSSSELSRRAAERARRIVDHVQSPEFKARLEEAMERARRAASIDFDKAIKDAANRARQIAEDYVKRHPGHKS